MASIERVYCMRSEAKPGTHNLLDYKAAVLDALRREGL
jgi:hypothetical protein